MRVDPRHLRNALAIAQYGTFNRAAEEIGVSQPALSKSIVLLEAAIGAKLFDRGKRGTKLTEAGQILIGGARNMENMLARTQEAIRLNQEGGLGPLVIGATPSMLLGLLPQTLCELLKFHQTLSISITEGLDGALVPALKRGEIEILAGPLETSKQSEPNIAEIALMREKFYIALPNGHPKSKARELDIADLSEEPWALPTPGSSFYKTIEAMFLAKGAKIPINAVSTNSLTMQEWLVENAGRASIITPAQLSGRPSPFTTVPLTGSPWRTVGIRHLEGQTLSAVSAAFIELFAQAISKLRHPGIEHLR